jgi:acetolactate synthase-1/2/3 large subunit
MGLGAFPQSHELSLRWLGMHGTVYSNNAVNEADLLIAVGARFDDRVTGKFAAFCEHGTIVHIDIDNAEINKNKIVRLPIQSDVKYALARLNTLLANAGLRAEIERLHALLRVACADRRVEERLSVFLSGHRRRDSAAVRDRATARVDRLARRFITTGVGQHQMWAAQYYPIDRPRQFISSLGPRLDGLSAIRRRSVRRSRSRTRRSSISTATAPSS